MRMSDRGLNLLKCLEGLGDGDKKKPGLQPYICPAGVWTIGYGHAIKGARGHLLRADNAADIDEVRRLYPAGKGISEQEAERLLKADLNFYEKSVYSLVAPSKGFTSQCQFDALVSLAFNIGIHGFETSTVLRLHRAGCGVSNLEDDDPILDAIIHGRAEPTTAADAILMWNKSGGKRILIRRRRIERMVYLARDVNHLL